jgi:cold shock CspA family protein
MLWFEKRDRITPYQETRAMRGQVKFYDRTTAWGLVLGDDGKLYGVTGARTPDTALTEGEYIFFEPQAAPGGPRAAAVRRLRPAEGPGGRRTDDVPPG